MGALLRTLPAALILSLVGAGGVVQADDLGADAPRRFTRVRAPKGIQIRRYNKTQGRSPEKNDRITVRYHGTLEDGRVFDTTRKRGRPISMRLESTIECWKIALPLLHVGESAQIICPGDVAYGPKGSPPKIPGNARLTFEVELLGVQ